MSAPPRGGRNDRPWSSARTSSCGHSPRACWGSALGLFPGTRLPGGRATGWAGTRRPCPDRPGSAGICGRTWWGRKRRSAARLRGCRPGSRSTRWRRVHSSSATPWARTQRQTGTCRGSSGPATARRDRPWSDRRSHADYHRRGSCPRSAQAARSRCSFPSGSGATTAQPLRPDKTRRRYRTPSRRPRHQCLSRAGLCRVPRQ